MELDILNPGRYKPEEIVIGHNMGWVKVDGKWYATNHRSSNPLHMRNRDQRAQFARAIKVTLKEVENWRRRKRREQEKEYLADELCEARKLLQANGYNVIDTKDR